ncbi:hypothetical protein DUI87_11896 [Hirundo rustica rustica]|uniref:Uncharacterized protein n=1 Tax=Hirundo rustica rustica TaxID=333673 RepID=A0A3M0KGQ3_HIRRU|nr:hypothetical protein DUI87_11896 [Hirundo rustica rustica]
MLDIKTFSLRRKLVDSRVLMGFSRVPEPGCGVPGPPLLAAILRHSSPSLELQDLTLGLVDPHTIVLSSPINSAQVSLQSPPALEQIQTPTQLGVICKCIEHVLKPHALIINKDAKRELHQH